MTRVLGFYLSLKRNSFPEGMMNCSYQYNVFYLLGIHISHGPLININMSWKISGFRRNRSSLDSHLSRSTS